MARERHPGRKEKAHGHHPRGRRRLQGAWGTGAFAGQRLCRLDPLPRLRGDSLDEAVLLGRSYALSAGQLVGEHIPETAYLQRGPRREVQETSEGQVPAPCCFQPLLEASE